MIPTSLAVRGIGALSVVLGMSLTQWFWTGVPTPVGIIICLALFPPTLLIQVGVSFLNEYTDMQIQRKPQAD